MQNCLLTVSEMMILIKSKFSYDLEAKIKDEFERISTNINMIHYNNLI